MPSVAQYKRFSTAALVIQRDNLFSAIQAQLLRGRAIKVTTGNTDIERQMGDLVEMQRNLAAIEKALYQLDPVTYPNNPSNKIATCPDWARDSAFVQ